MDKQENYDFTVAIVGGGISGIAAAKSLSSLLKRTSN